MSLDCPQTKDFVFRAPASARLEASVSFLQGEKRQLAKANKEETEETEEEEVSEMHIETGSPSHFQK